MSQIKSLDGVFRLAHALKSQLQSQIDSLDLGVSAMHMRVMKIIHKQAPCTAMDIVNYLHRDKAQVTRLIKTLLDLGFIDKSANPDDQRSQLLVLTNKGNDALEQLAKIDTQVFAKMTTDINDVDLVDFMEIAARMSNNLR
ncbi:MarR family transcriptional regulator [Alginatibacterium sediminis]|uniref:MarR family transcriptional regulator n=1 Tax=Alginatibacterium sediminis TaxID=2164068 RepID=A0A420EGS3_9ALTE|nr:MarR family transcriptional regulator [Alginatibacterium sediminis]RKF19878.1 MarR family transcriptional regulator [Alginatibacterium sediminis]